MSNKPKLIVLQGGPATGKSTWVQYYLDNHKNTFVVSRDNFRDMQGGRARLQKGTEALIDLCETHCIIDALTVGWDCIVDATNLNQKKILELTELATDNGAELVVEKFDCTFEDAIRRDQRRHHAVGAHVLKIFADKYDAYKNCPAEITPDLERRWCKYRYAIVADGFIVAGDEAGLRDLGYNADIFIIPYKGTTVEKISQRLDDACLPHSIINIDEPFEPKTRKGAPRVYILTSADKSYEQMYGWVDYRRTILYHIR